MMVFRKLSLSNTDGWSIFGVKDYRFVRNLHTSDVRVLFFILDIMEGHRKKLTRIKYTLYTHIYIIIGLK